MVKRPSLAKRSGIARTTCHTSNSVSYSKTVKISSDVQLSIRLNQQLTCAQVWHELTMGFNQSPVWRVPISGPVEDRRLSWPGRLG